LNFEKLAIGFFQCNFQAPEPQAYTSDKSFPIGHFVCVITERELIQISINVFFRYPVIYSIHTSSNQPPKSLNCVCIDFKGGVLLAITDRWFNSAIFFYRVFDCFVAVFLFQSL